MITLLIGLALVLGLSLPLMLDSPPMDGILATFYIFQEGKF
jgi:hypothetical protein